ncbi:hypothetical protein [Psychrobacillus sp. FSL K6-1267]|uniref:hypothetical protein n=1 Tax=Psychrobacillus sp. FSL K6-1267 TaxID=2921543 RepID=UPI0030FD0883
MRKPIKLSKESERQIVIQDLTRLGIYEDKKGEPIHSLSYFSLVHLLAMEKAVGQ